jgi:hypothetical protein
MSNAVTNLCRPIRMPPPQKSVLMCLADIANEHAVAWPSLRLICQWTCFSRSTVIEALTQLQRSGLITILKNKGRNNRCTFVLDAIAVKNSEARAAFAGDIGGLDARQPSTAIEPPPVRQPDHPSPATGPETSSATTKTSSLSGNPNNAIEAAHAVLPEVLRQTLSDWIEVRNAKRSGPLTLTAAQGLRREAARAGLSTQEALEKCCAWSWGAFSANWHAQRTSRQRSAASPSAETFRQRDALRAAERVFEATGGLLGSSAAPRPSEPVSPDRSVQRVGHERNNLIQAPTNATTAS